jgi:hypothetical protein
MADHADFHCGGLAVSQQGPQAIAQQSHLRGLHALHAVGVLRGQRRGDARPAPAQRSPGGEIGRLARAPRGIVGVNGEKIGSRRHIGVFSVAYRSVGKLRYGSSLVS